MCNARLVSILFACASFLTGCGSEPPAASAPPSPPPSAMAEESTRATADTASTETQLSGELKVLTAEDMERLQKERKEQIDRSTPLGEEKDPVKDVQKSKSGGGSD